MTASLAPGTDGTALPDPSRPAAPPAVQRLRLITICLGLVLLVFSQSAGYTAADTKLDLVVDPLRFLRRSLTLWDPLGAAGQLQNQAYGYLFPMGPFFALGKLLGLPAWVVQRSWESALVLAAFLGMLRLARLLGVSAFWPKVAAGLTYALAPRMLSELGSISSELMPVAALPWILIPLVAGSERGSPRRAGALAGVALLFAGGVNAAATLAVLPVPVLWLLTRQPGRRRRQLMLWFGVSVVLASAWWAIPLLLLGRYSPPFLDWIESSQVTTGVTSLIGSLRGVDHWQAYLGPGVWPAGWILVAVPAVVLATTAVAAAGLAGIARRDQPHRAFAIGCLLLGLVCVTMGYLATVGPPAGAALRSLLDGPLNAFRNVHKFDPLIRLPIALGVGWLLNRLRLPARWQPRWRGMVLDLRPRPLAALLALSIAALAVAPAITNSLVPAPRGVTEASWWRETGAWLGAHSGAGRSLVVPGASRPVYLWGATVDDALQPVATAPWTVRDGIPLASAGYIRLLDDLTVRLSAGRRDDDLPVLLARAGIRYLVVRNDLDTVASGSANPAFVHASIAATPGFTAVADFGAARVNGLDRAHLVDVGATVTRPAVQVYEVAGWSGMVGLLPAAGLVRATGSADQLGPLVSAGLGTDAPVLFGSDGRDTGAAGLNVATDGIRRREASFGQPGGLSATLTGSQPYRQSRAAQDYLPATPGPLSSVAYGGGLSDVRASSSGADAGALVNPGPANGPWSALDGDPATAWKSSALTGGVNQWLSVQLSQPISTSTVEIAFAAGLGGYPNRVRVSTDAGTLDADVTAGPFGQRLALPAGPTQNLRITVLSVTPGTGSVGLATLTVPGLSPFRTLQVPTSGTPDLLVFATEAGGRPSCLTVAGRAACDPMFAAAGESDGVIDRTFDLAGGQRYRLAATVLPAPGPALDRLLDAGRAVTATASTVDDPDPRERPGAAVDGDPTTSWVARAGDLKPSLTLDLGRPRTISTLRLQTDPDSPSARPEQVVVRVADKQWSLPVPEDGVLTLPEPTSSRTVRISVARAELRLTTSTLYGTPRFLPAGIAEIAVNGRTEPRATGEVRLDCSAGLAALVDGVRVPLQVGASREQLLTGAPLRAAACGAEVALAPGRHRVQLGRSALTAGSELVLSRAGLTLPQQAAGASAGVVTPLVWHPTRRTVRVSTSAAALLVIRENANAGWQASLDGRRLKAVRLDGWQQGFELPAAANGVVRLHYAPQAGFQAGLVLGLLAALGLCWLAWRRPGPQAAPQGSESPEALQGPQPTGEPTAGALAERDVPPALVTATAVLAAFVLTGLIGLVAVAAALAVRALAARRRLALPAWSVAVGVCLAGAAEAWHPAQDPHPLAGSPWAQTLCVLAVCLTVVGLGRPRQDESENRRSNGRSTRYQDAVPSTVAETVVTRKNVVK
ncbi:alpha-(1-_3)-arabinofuranosyltransferase domain-containing protein [Jatrophihabitans sp.]|uniref:alpha-(1->3)-arabinofuranosyltransferase domain-containing protein n=1 Tax=Jatrophihabitans sp. TaxID=1932789 RepID=UPI002C90D0DC|nr:alpha-(1->3)-arabinofuranosyltransferase family protein [Jatrophihabitans sp.]